jgi:hypothetical protein
MASVWLDGYAASTDSYYGSGGLYDQIGVAYRKRLAEPTFIEGSYKGAGILNPTNGPQLLAVSIDAPDLRHIKLVFDTAVFRGSGAITVSDNFVVGSIIFSGRIVYLTLNKPAYQPTKDAPTDPKPTTITLAAGAFYCWVAAQNANVGNVLVSNRAIARGTPWTIDTTTLATKPLWAFYWYYFNKLTPPLIRLLTADALTTTDAAPVIPPDPNAASPAQRWYVTNGATEVNAGGTFTGVISAGGDSLKVSCKLRSDSVQSLKPFGTAVITALPTGQAWSVECTAVDTCSASGGGGAATFIGQVLGGNVPITATAALDNTKPVLTTPPAYAEGAFPNPDTTPDAYGYVDTAYPTRRPFAYTLPTVDALNQRLGAPLVNDWRKYDLPSTYVLGGALPRLPDGLCYVRVERPFTTSTGVAWDANDSGAPLRPATGAQLPVKAHVTGNTIVAWYKYTSTTGLPAGATAWIVNASLTTPDLMNGYFTLLRNGNPIVITGGWTLGIGAATFGSNGDLTLTVYKFKALNTPVAIVGTETPWDGVTIQIKNNLLIADGAFIATSPPDTTLSVSELQDRSVVVVCLNDVSKQGFRAGDLVYVQDTAVTLADRYDLVGTAHTRQVFRILGGISGVKNNLTGF